MRAPGFWQRPPGLAARLLSPLALVYGALTARRMRRPGARAACPVICIGNVTAGGSGKTPTALAIAALLIARGERPVFLTRGYGGRQRGPLAVDPALHDAREVGDEALLLARAAPCVVARDRIAGAALCATLGASVIVMDDGLQNPSLHKDLALAVFDAGTGIGNGLCLPAGPLRAPLAAQWPLIDAVVMVGDGPPARMIAREAERRGLPVLRAGLEPDPETAASLRGRRVLAFAGIGRPPKFFETLEACGARVETRKSFPDHHPFTAREIGDILDQAEREGLLAITTEKDRVRLATMVGREPRLAHVETLPVTIVFEEQARLDALVAGIAR